MTIFKDVTGEEEDDRITQIGNAAMGKKMVVVFITDDEAGKADRYISKLQKRFPSIRVIDRGGGPVANSVFVKVGPPVN